MAENRPVPQQAMGGQPGVQPRPANLPTQPSQQKQIQPIQPREFPTTFYGFSLRKAAADPGERPSWDKIKTQPFPVSAKEFNSENRSARSPASPYKVYEHLRTDSQREAIDRLINNFRAHETNLNAVWEIAYIRPNRAVIPGSWGRLEETKDIRLIFKRSALPYGQQPNPEVAQFPYGRIIDTTVEEPFPVPVQKNIQSQPLQTQQAQPLPIQKSIQLQHLQPQQAQPLPTQKNIQLQHPQTQQAQPGQQGGAKNLQQQQQQMNQHHPNQQHPGPMAMPPQMGMNGHPLPPPHMPPPFGGNQLPPPSMQGHPPPGAMQSNRPNPGNAAPVTQIFNLAPPEKQKKQKLEKAKSNRRRSQSPPPRNKLRQSMDALEKFNKWQQLPTESDSESESDNSDSGNDSDSSLAAHRGYRHRAKEGIPPPPMGPYASGALTPRSRSPPAIKRKSSLKVIRGKNKRLTEREKAERYRRESSGSDGSYDMVDRPVSHRRQYDDTPPTSVSSHSFGSSDRGSHEHTRRSRYSHRERNRSRQRTHHDRAVRHSRSRSYDRVARRDRSRDRDRSPTSADRKSNRLREHRQPEAYRGLTPPPPQKSEPIVVHNHIHTSNNDRFKPLPPPQQQQTAMRTSPSYSSPPLSMATLSPNDFSYTGINPAHHIPTPLYPTPTTTHPSIPQNSLLYPHRNEQRAQAAHDEYIHTQHRRDTLADLQMRQQLQKRKDRLLADQWRRERERGALPLHLLPPRNGGLDSGDGDFSWRRDGGDWRRSFGSRWDGGGGGGGVRFGKDGMGGGW